MGWVGLLLKHALRLKAHFFVHTDWLEYLIHNSGLDQRGLDRVRRMLRWFYQQWDGLFVLNRQHVEWLAGVAMDIPRDRLHLTAHWVAQEYHPGSGLPPEGHPLTEGFHPTLLFAGRLSEEKGILDVVEAWKLIRVRVPEAKLVFAGTGPAEAKLRNLVPEAQFVGWVDRETLASWFRASALMLFPSRFDTFGCAVLEALSCGLPVACYPVKGPADLVEDEVNGLLCEHPADMAEKVVTFLRAPKARRDGFRQGAIASAERYKAEEIMDRLLVDVGLGCGMKKLDLERQSVRGVMRHHAPACAVLWLYCACVPNFAWRAQPNGTIAKERPSHGRYI
jgi:glycosyltransferase involved in cell wall biosynthesis